MCQLQLLFDRPSQTFVGGGRLVALLAVLLSFGVVGSGVAQVRINEVVASNLELLEDEDRDTPDWIELYNAGDQAVDLSGYGLSDDPDEPFRWIFPSGAVMNAGEYRVIFASDKNRFGPLHTNFKLSASGEEIVLTEPSGITVDQLSTGRLYVDVSVGRGDDGERLYFFSPTPKAENSTFGLPAFTEAVTLSPAGGFFEGSVTVDVQNPPDGALLYYSLDGTEPTSDSLPWTGPLVFDQPINTLRVRAIRDGEWPSPPATGSYLFDPDVSLPVISIVMEPDDLFGDDGVYDNLFGRLERPMHVDFIERDGSLGFSVDAGTKLHGGGSVFNAQKSLRLILRGGYGVSELDYPVFGEEYEVSQFKRLIFRAHGQDFRRANMRDPHVQSLTEGEDLDTQAYQPAVTFLNGEYWGVYNIRERHDEFYADSRKGTEDVDLLERNRSVVEGDREHYDAMLEFIEQNDMTDPANYDYIKTQMEVDEYSTYVIFEVYSGNTDWPTNNIKFWRPRTPDGRWRWMMYDTEFGMGLFAGGPENDTMRRLLDRDDLPEWTTELFQGLIVNDEFRNGFLNRYADYLNTRLTPPELRARLMEMASGINVSMPGHQFRWGSTYGAWRDQVAEIADWANRRPGFARQHLVDNFFQIEGNYDLSLDVTPAGSGAIGLTAISVDEPFTGGYFLGVPVTLTAEPAPGFGFVGWSDPDLPQEASIEILPDGDYTVTALFGPGSDPGDVVIHEINYNSDDTFDPGDWVELFNPGDAEFDLSGWTLRDEDDLNVFTFADGTVLGVEEYLVITNDLPSFGALFPEVENVVGEPDFGFGGGGDQVRLLTPEGVVYDFVEYDDQAPWPTEPDGEGPTLELIDAALDNSQPESWATSVAEHGTPGRANGER